MLLSKASISNSRALMKAATLSSPDVDRAASADWTGIARASCAFCRFRELDVCVVGTLRFWPAANEGVDAITCFLERYRRSWFGGASRGSGILQGHRLTWFSAVSILHERVGPEPRFDQNGLGRAVKLISTDTSKFVNQV